MTKKSWEAHENFSQSYENQTPELINQTPCILGCSIFALFSCFSFSFFILCTNVIKSSGKNFKAVWTPHHNVICCIGNSGKIQRKFQKIQKSSIFSKFYLKSFSFINFWHHHDMFQLHSKALYPVLCSLGILRGPKWPKPYRDFDGNLLKISEFDKNPWISRGSET